MKKAIVFGASGFVGSHLLELLLGSPAYEQVTVVVRRELPINHPKLKVLMGDFSSLASLKDHLAADDLFLALGTTKKSTPNPHEYYQVDHDYPLLAARLARGNGAKSVFLVTGVGANAQSRFAYIKAKGELERDVIALNFDHTHIFCPSMILGNRSEHRSNEKLLIAAWSLANSVLVGPLRSYRGIDGKDIAAAMYQAAMGPAEKVTRYHWSEMQALLTNGRKS